MRFLTAIVCLFAPIASFHAQELPRSALSVLDYLPKNHVTDGTISYRIELQKALDAAALANRPLVFPPMIYRVDESGLELRSGLTMHLTGAIFRVDEACKKDGRVFFGKGVEKVTLIGGEIVGRNDVWPEGVNIKGVELVGPVKDIRIRDMTIRDLSSVGIGFFGDAKTPARDVWITDCVIVNCCNLYHDYLSPKVGPEKGSVREDQGLIALYHVRDWTVRGCRLEKSRSDGTHFYRCQDGHFIHNRVIAAQMGGYFLEGCTDIVADGNIIKDNGSRGVTIERGSLRCTLKGNVIANSGREGLWAPTCSNLVVIGNIFDKNGRKPLGEKAHQIWNANITVNDDHTDPTKSKTTDYLIADNIITTTSSQVAAMRFAGMSLSGIVVRNNLLRGENRRIAMEGNAKDGVTLIGND